MTTPCSQRHRLAGCASGDDAPMDTYTLPWPHRLASWRHRIPANDGFELLLAIWVAVVVLAGMPMAVAVGSSVHESQSRLYAQQAQNRQSVTAVVTGDKVAHQELADPQTVSVPARWVAAGVEHAGPVSAPRGVKAGDSVDIWVDESGYHIGLPDRTALDEAVAAGLSSWLGMAAVTAVLLAGAWAVTDRVRGRRVPLSSGGGDGSGIARR
ncbi:hypothetical protein B1987_26455 [Mycobacterium kansasii]|uniref:Putative membrane protein n=1 Tax=Mycobacterium attenuatum TaxID=2341086 RepID=A0A498PW48_9MYCO|nr:hypothetical protein [Mycobacterium attenuatum]ORB86724.1 hypothetical protein B1987_26455 [Mycobacterium kansasii]VBA37976.1 putative membrane protein [Mycobacterium attenuatum]VBA51464.1 putative membrane protein [Mycobacterium attenuatum]